MHVYGVHINSRSIVAHGENVIVDVRVHGAAIALMENVREGIAFNPQGGTRIAADGIAFTAQRSRESSQTES